MTYWGNVRWPRIAEYEMAEWRKYAACRHDIDPAIFHQTIPAKRSSHAYHEAVSKTKKAINICRSCPAAIGCAREQARLKAPGVWAGARWIPTHKGGLIKDERFVA